MAPSVPVIGFFVLWGGVIALVLWGVARDRRRYRRLFEILESVGFAATGRRDFERKRVEGTYGGRPALVEHPRTRELRHFAGATRVAVTHRGPQTLDTVLEAGTPGGRLALTQGDADAADVVLAAGARHALARLGAVRVELDREFLHVLLAGKVFDAAPIGEALRVLDGAAMRLERGPEPFAEPRAE